MNFVQNIPFGVNEQPEVEFWKNIVWFARQIEKNADN